MLQLPGFLRPPKGSNPARSRPGWFTDALRRQEPRGLLGAGACGVAMTKAQVHLPVDTTLTSAFQASSSRLFVPQTLPAELNVVKTTRAVHIVRIGFKLAALFGAVQIQ